MSWPTAKRWVYRYRAMGAKGMADRSSRPHRQPGRTPAPVVRKIVHLSWKQRLGPVAIGDQLGIASSTVYAVLVRAGSTGSPTSTGSPANRSAATSTLPRVFAARGRQETGQLPRRRRVAVRGTPTRHEEPLRHQRQTTKSPPQTRDKVQFPLRDRHFRASRPSVRSQPVNDPG